MNTLKVSVLICFSIFFVKAYAENTALNKGCVNLTGTYRMPPLPKTGKSPIMIIDQYACGSISVLINMGGMIPIGPEHSLDGSEGYRIVGNTIVLRYSGNEAFSTITSHGQCLARQQTLSLDQDGNLVETSPKIFKCADGYQGPYEATYQRLR